MLSGDWFCCPCSCHKVLQRLLETESELHCLATVFVKPAKLSADYVCLVSYISSYGHFIVLYS